MGMKSLVDAEDKHSQLLGHLMVIVAKVARDLGLTDGYRTVINNGDHGCQKIKSFYIQVFGNQQLKWPPYEGELQAPQKEESKAVVNETST